MGQAFYEGTGRKISERAAGIIIGRVLFMSLGTWITIGTLGIQCFIWYYERQKLRWWCESSAFGISRNNDWSAETQVNVLTDALDALGIRQ